MGWAFRSPGLGVAVAFFLFGSDLAFALIGPFASVADAEAHAAFCVARGDAAILRVVGSAEADAVRPDCGVVLTPEADRAFVCPD